MDIAECRIPQIFHLILDRFPPYTGVLFSVWQWHQLCSRFNGLHGSRYHHFSCCRCLRFLAHTSERIPVITLLNFLSQFRRESGPHAICFQFCSPSFRPSPSLEFAPQSVSAGSSRGSPETPGKVCVRYLIERSSICLSCQESFSHCPRWRRKV